MITIGTVERTAAAEWFPFLSEDYRGRRTAIRELTHGMPEFVFWIYPDGTLHNTRNSHKSYPPPGYSHIVNDEPDYGGFLRGRVVRNCGRQLIVVYCRQEALADRGKSLIQLLNGLEQMPMPIDGEGLVISDNADIYGTVDDLWNRLYQHHDQKAP